MACAYFDRAWVTRWQHSNDCRQTKVWFPNGTIPEVTKSLLSKNRTVLGIMIQFLTGHGWLRRHSWIVDSNYGAKPSTIDPMCRLCGIEEESPVHLWTCVKAKEGFLSTTKSWSVSVLDRFIRTNSMVMLLEQSQEYQIVEV